MALILRNVNICDSEDVSVFLRVGEKGKGSEKRGESVSPCAVFTPFFSCMGGQQAIQDLGTMYLVRT